MSNPIHDAADNAEKYWNENKFVQNITMTQWVAEEMFTYVMKALKQPVTRTGCDSKIEDKDCTNPAAFFTDEEAHLACMGCASKKPDEKWIHLPRTLGGMTSWIMKYL